MPKIYSDTFAASEPLARDQRFRIEMTASCRDCESIPKVDGAGDIRIENGERVQIMHNGMRVVADGYCGPWMTEIISRLHGHHEPQEELVFSTIMSFLPPDASMIELGGYWCYYALWFLQSGARRRALVVEPDPNYLAVGRRNAALNGKEIDFLQAFVGEDNRDAAPFQTDTAGIQHLPMRRVSHLCREWAPQGLDVLHCDAQGSETSVLADCEQLLRAGMIDFLVVSTHGETISGDPLTHQRCLSMVKQFGGQILAEHDVHESFSGDGLIAAYFGSRSLNMPRPCISYNRYSKSLFRNPLYDLRLTRLELEAARSATQPRE